MAPEHKADNSLGNRFKRRRHGVARFKTRCRRMYEWLLKRKNSSRLSTSSRLPTPHEALIPVKPPIMPPREPEPENNSKDEDNSNFWVTMAEASHFRLRSAAQSASSFGPQELTRSSGIENTGVEEDSEIELENTEPELENTEIEMANTGFDSFLANDFDSFLPLDDFLSSPFDETFPVLASPEQPCTTVGLVSPYHKFMELFKFVLSTPWKKDVHSICHALSCIARSKPTEFSRELFYSCPPSIQRRKAKYWGPATSTRQKKPAGSAKKPFSSLMLPSQGLRPPLGSRIQGVLEKLKQCADSLPILSQESPMLEKVRLERITFHLARLLGLRAH